MLNIIAKPSSSNANKTGGWRTFKPVTDLDKCVGCGLCSKICPESAIVMIEKDSKKKPTTNMDYCKGCGLCAAECPVKAIKMEVDNK